MNTTDVTVAALPTDDTLCTLFNSRSTLSIRAEYAACRNVDPPKGWWLLGW